MEEVEAVSPAHQLPSTLAAIEETWVADPSVLVRFVGLLVALMWPRQGGLSCLISASMSVCGGSTSSTASVRASLECGTDGPTAQRRRNVPPLSVDGDWRQSC